MTHQEIGTAEEALVHLATADSHLELARTYLRHGMPRYAQEELKHAQRHLHQTKLLVIAVRWMDSPGTLKKLLKEQVQWLEKRYRGT